MWKEKLPNNCPPESAKELEIEVFRILLEEESTENDFVTYSNLYPENIRYKLLCKAHAISFYDSVKNAEKAWKEASERGKNLGNYIGKYSISIQNGRNLYSSETGHYSTWFYNTWDYQNFIPSFVSEINEN